MSRWRSGHFAVSKLLAGVAALILMESGLAYDAEAQILGTADSFAVLAGTTVTNTGPSVIGGSVGVSPGSAIVGFPPGLVTGGTIHGGDAVATQAQSDLTNAYNNLWSRPFTVDLTGQNLGGLILGPGVYRYATSAQLTGVLTLNGLGNSASEFIFQIGSTLTTASNSAVLLINGANGNNVYWAVGSSVTLGTNTVFTGNIVALTSITLNTGATINCGRALARNGAVTLDNNTITLCAAQTPSGSTPSGSTPSGSTPGSRSASYAGGGSGSSDITLNDLFGEGVSGTQQTSFRAARLFGSTMISQAAFWREGTGPDLTGITPQTYRSLKDGPSEGEPHGMLANGNLPRTWRLWTTGFGGTTSLNGDEATGSSDLATYTTGFAVGLDFQIDRTTLIGVAGGYTNSRFSVDQRLTGGIIEGGHVGLYGVKRLGPFYLAATAEYAKFSNETARVLDWVVEERARGSFTSDEASARLEAGWRRSFAGVHVTPFAGIEISHLRSEGFTEKSQGILGLTFGSVSVNSLQSSLGIQLESRMAFVNGQALTPFARIAWGHEFNPDRSIRSFLTLSPLASFSPDGASAASDFAKLHAGVKLDITKGLGLFAVFDGEFSDLGQSYAGNGGIRISW